ncbi:hypothetical protein VOLCADRAFT_120441 [Volvox carteri f. nagariensis]|uniref:Uncharacterized protein n=1 Tax=Volvox carteri f. nagariensis TaxID=3068 RepID=D8TLH7_VOLCA|nr:uncharacterized protein VOLCADRAFT_120441 [Volvox carteri f. nagariensis]EFJ51876.1 hypothetical protein VOLCADRAFT_120441 [Volvox carteri f. nagariensis]|eukprot:XP_002947286.1 hypothetical protein VOLCADRAFT_120441 [Volvox carteri f. nagariensis]
MLHTRQHAHASASSTRRQVDALLGRRAWTPWPCKTDGIYAFHTSIPQPCCHSTSSSSTPAPMAFAEQDGAFRDPAASTATPATQTFTWLTCRRCKKRFVAEQNHRGACRYHSEGWTGGELAKAVGFVRRSEAPEHQLAAVMGRTGLLRFWDCCGAEDEDAPGCQVSFHLTFDEEENERRGWC